MASSTPRIDLPYVLLFLRGLNVTASFSRSSNTPAAAIGNSASRRTAGKSGKLSRSHRMTRAAMKERSTFLL